MNKKEQSNEIYCSLRELLTEIEQDIVKFNRINCQGALNDLECIKRMLEELRDKKKSDK